MLTLLSQRDLRWASVKLGNSSLTMGRFGCTTTCLSMLTSYFGGFVFPDAIAKNGGNYTKDGLVVWQSLSFKDMQFVKRLQMFSSLDVDASIKGPDTAVILNVNDGTHWVVAIRKMPWGDYLCADPWTGGYCLVKQRYHNIVGSSHFKRKI